jgi:lysyl-tRNA synthetase class 2
VSESGDLREQRLQKLRDLRAKGVDPFPARFAVTHTASEALALLGSDAPASHETVLVAGRVMALRIMGKVSFAHIMDHTGQVQIYVRQDQVGEAAYDGFRQSFDVGDFVGIEGTMFRTRTGEITVRVQRLVMLAKALRPLPEKWHGLTDVETRYRQRYLDLIANSDTRRTFQIRTRMVSAIRRFLDESGFLEVETPVLQPVYGGAAARPFVTHHNVLDTDLYLRISDELYLKRLIIGGLERVYEIGRDFRNEGVSTVHNPEFTQIEVYQAYADYHDMMRLVEELWSKVALDVLGTSELSYQGQRIDLTPPWRRMTMREGILDATGIDIEADGELQPLHERISDLHLSVELKPTWGKQVEELFEAFVQPGLVQPTFVLDYPVDVSPLAKKKPDKPKWVERFEFFVGALECGNAFSELNDPIDQRQRFHAQLAKSGGGDEEAHPMDEDWIRALEHGMPPTGGLGWGIDRMAMLFTNNASIREVILFPTLRPKPQE